MLCLLLPARSHAQPADTTGRAAIPAYEGYVTDVAHVLSDDRRAQLEGFLDLLEGRPEPRYVSLREGLEVVAIAEAVLASAASGDVVRPVVEPEVA